MGYDCSFKLADFGVSDHIKEDGDDTISKSAGTPAFMAPECCEPGSFSGKQADLWAAAVSLYFMLHELHVIYQFWVHTTLVRRLPAPIEFIFNTPLFRSDYSKR